MFQGSEIFVILLVALVVLGPERLPAVARKLGKWTAELRSAASELRAGLESEIGDVRQIVDDVRAPMDEVKRVATETTSEARAAVSESDAEVRKTVDPARWVGPKPISGPTPEDAMRDLESIEETGKPLDDVADETTG